MKAKREMKVYVAKIKLMVTDKKAEVVRSGRPQCAVCGMSLGQNSILCAVCGFWSINRCYIVRKINNAPDLQLPTCNGQNKMEEVQKPRDDLQLEILITVHFIKFPHLMSSSVPSVQN